MNKFITVLTILFIALNYKFTNGESNIFEYIELKEQVIKLKKEDETEMSYRIEVAVGGKLAQVGSRLVSGAAKKLAGQFFEKFGKQLTTT